MFLATFIDSEGNETRENYLCKASSIEEARQKAMKSFGTLDSQRVFVVEIHDGYRFTLADIQFAPKIPEDFFASKEIETEHTISYYCDHCFNNNFLYLGDRVVCKSCDKEFSLLRENPEPNNWYPENGIVIY